MKNENDEHYLKIARLLASLVSIIMIVGAIILSQAETKTLQDTIVTLISLLMGGVMGLYMLGFLTRRGDSRTAWIGIIVTFVFSLWTVLSSRGVLPDWLTVPFDLYYTGLIGNVVMFSTIFILAVMISGKKRELKNLTVWTQDGKVIDN